jgi:hypothetical protein
MRAAVALILLLAIPAAAQTEEDRVGLWLFGPPRYSEGETRTVAVTMVNEGGSHLLLEKVVLSGALRAMADWSEPARFGAISYEAAQDLYRYDPRPAKTTGRVVRGGLLAPGQRAEKELSAYAVGGGSGTVHVRLTVQPLSPEETSERFYFRVSTAAAPEVFRRLASGSAGAFIVRSTEPFAREPRTVEVSASVVVAPAAPQVPPR